MASAMTTHLRTYAELAAVTADIPAGQIADHRADRKAWLTEMLGLPATDPARYTWQLVEPGDQDHMPTGQRLLHVVADRMHWLQALDQARKRAAGQAPDHLPATGRAA